MVYLYAVMGLVMMAGIMSVFEMGILLKGQAFLLKPDNPYRQSLLTNSVGKRDRQMLNMLHNQNDLLAMGLTLQGNNLCNALLCRSSLAGAAYCSVGNAQASDAESRLPDLNNLMHAKTPDVNGPFARACALDVGSHRLLIRPHPAQVGSSIPYGLFSCVLSRGSETCDFESNR